MELSLAFKGDRDYVQGPDIFDGVVRALGEDDDMYVESLSFRKFARHNCEVFEEEPKEDTVARGKWRGTDGRTSPFWVAETGSPITRRVDFDEALIVDAAEREGRIIRVGFRPEFSLMEQFVAVTKTLNYGLVPNPSGRWIVAEIRTSRPVPSVWANETLRVEQMVNTANRFTRNEIFIDEVSFGELRFIVSSF